MSVSMSSYPLQSASGRLCNCASEACVPFEVRDRGLLPYRRRPGTCFEGIGEPPRGKATPGEADEGRLPWLVGGFASLARQLWCVFICGVELGRSENALGRA